MVALGIFDVGRSKSFPLFKGICRIRKIDSLFAFRQYVIADAMFVEAIADYQATITAAAAAAVNYTEINSMSINREAHQQTEYLTYITAPIGGKLD